MDPERWNHVDKLLQSALDLPRGGARRVSAATPAAATSSWSTKSARCSPPTTAPTAFSALRRSISPHAQLAGRAQRRRQPGRPRSADRSDALALPHRREAGRRRHGRRLQGRGCAAAALRRAEVPVARPRRRSRCPGPIPPRGAGRIGVESRQHLHRPRHRRTGRPRVPRDGVPRRDDAEASHRPGARSRSTCCWRWRSRSPTRSRRRTTPGSSTATSSRRICSSPAAATPRFSTSAWPKSVRVAAETTPRRP